MKSVKISLGDFTSLVSQEALARHSKLSIDTSVPVPAYQVQSPVRRENVDQFLAWLEHPAEITCCITFVACHEICASRAVDVGFQHVYSSWSRIDPERLFNLEREFSSHRASCDDLVFGHSDGGKSRSIHERRLSISGIPHFHEQLLIQER
jgi:hypothetical protein